MNTRLKVFLLQTPILSNIIVFLYRINIVLRFILNSSKNYLLALKWLFSSNETTNITYHITTINDEYLAALISDITNAKVNEVLAYFNELDANEALKNHIEKQVSLSKWAAMADKEVRFGRRKGWYAIVRIIKPKVVIETGVDKGLGACLITSALKKNAEEGFHGHYYGTDINPKAGYLLSDEYATYGEILYGDSIESLQKFPEKIDVFINDSDHSADYEAQEYDVIKPKLSGHAIILGDNSHGNNKLFQFSINNNRNFLFFKEQPANHWYSGEGIGFSFNKK